jgi:hypothetical protein
MDSLFIAGLIPLQAGQTGQPNIARFSRVQSEMVKLLPALNPFLAEF